MTGNVCDDLPTPHDGSRVGPALVYIFLMRPPYKLLALAPALFAACNLILQNDAAHRADVDGGGTPRPDTGPLPPGPDGGVDPDGGVALEASTPDAAPFDASAAPFRRVLFYGTGYAAGGGDSVARDVWTKTEDDLDAPWNRLGVDPGFALGGSQLTTDDEYVYYVAEKAIAVSPLTNGTPGVAEMSPSLPMGSGSPCTARSAPGTLTMGCAAGAHLVADVLRTDAGLQFGAVYTDPLVPSESARKGMFIQPTSTGFFGYDSERPGFEWNAATTGYGARARNGLPVGTHACSAIVNGIVYVIFPADSEGLNPEYFSSPDTADWGLLPASSSPRSIGAPLTCTASNRALYVTGPSTEISLLPQQAFAVSYVQPDGTLSPWTNLPPPSELSVGNLVGVVTTALPVPQ